MLTKRRRKVIMAITAVLIAVIVVIAVLDRQRKGQQENPYDYNVGRSENGYWEGLDALNYVEMFQYTGMEIPRDSHTVTDEMVDSEFYYTIKDLPPFTNIITDRSVMNGDAVVVDYIGCEEDGVILYEADVKNESILIGDTDYIDFDKLIGHFPGESVEIPMEFPNPYEVMPRWSGRKAVFTVKINNIVERRSIEDSDVAEHFSEEYGWTTIEQMREELRQNLLNEAIVKYIMNYFDESVTVNEIPLFFMEKIEERMIEFYTKDAESRGMTLGQLLEEMQFDGINGLLEYHRESNLENARHWLILQAIAEDMGLEITDGDIRDNYGEDYEENKKTYGIPYMAQRTMYEKVMKYIVDNAVKL